MSRPQLPAQAQADAQTQAGWERLDCGFAAVAEVFADCLDAARAQLPSRQLEAYLDGARVIGKLGRGAEPMLAFLEEWPAVARAIGASADERAAGADRLLPRLMDCVGALQHSPNGRAIAPLLQTLAAVARRLQTPEQISAYLDLVVDLAQRTTTAIHGRQGSHPSPGLPEFLNQAPRLAGQLTLDGIRSWVDFGVRHSAGHPQREIDYFALQSADSRAVLQRERHGTLLADVERRLELTLRALWDEAGPLRPYSTAHDELRQPVPYDDGQGLHLPDVLEARAGVAAIDRYHAALAHLAGHRRWSRPLCADNWSPFQRLAVEFFEDSRIDTLVLRRFPGLRRSLLALHPHPREDSCDARTTSCLRHRLAMVSRALLDPGHDYRDPELLETVRRFAELLCTGESNTAQVAELAIAYVARTRRQSDQLPKVHFDDTVIDYRDDNRRLWRFIENGDEEDSDVSHRPAPPETLPPGLPPRHYPEWDYQTQSYRPDWTSVYESLHPAGDAAQIDALLARNGALAQRLERLIESIKPQDRVRLRYQEDGSELDLDVAIGALIDLKSGHTPEARINMSHRHDGRDLAVLLLLDLSESLNDQVAGGAQSVLQLSQEAVALLAWAIDALGDKLAIAGFHSNTRHEVRYLHVKGYSEPWGDTVKARLAALAAGYSTRIGAAVRHAAHYLENQKASKKLLLILTDGEPADVDSPDPRSLIEDARQTVQELSAKGIYTHCISLDARADDYVSQIFGRRYTVIDAIERLPERLPQLFLALTK